MLVRPGRIKDFTETLGREIAAGAVSPGAALPAEPELMARFGLSRSVVREGIKTLSAKRLVAVSPRTGTRVRPRDEWQMLDRDVLTWIAASGRGGPELWRAIDEVRPIIEPAAAALAARRAEPAHLGALREAFAGMERAAQAGDAEAAIDADRAFHLVILKATKNPVLVSFETAVDAILGVLFRVTAGTHLSDFRANLANHGRVLAAIERGDGPEAERAMRDVIGFTHANLVKNNVL